MKKLTKDNFNQALAYALLLLKYRIRSKHETIARLDKKGYSCKTIQQVIDYLQEYKYLDDNKFAYNFIDYAIARGWGPRKIDYELKKFGISDDLRKKALTKANYQTQLRRLIEQKLELYRCRNKKVDFNQIRQKVLRLLMARGFSYQDIIRILENKAIGYSEDS